MNQFMKHNAAVIQLFIRPLGRPFVVISDFRETQDICARRTRCSLVRLSADSEYVLTLSD